MLRAASDRTQVCIHRFERQSGPQISGTEMRSSDTAHPFSSTASEPVVYPFPPVRGRLSLLRASLCVAGFWTVFLAEFTFKLINLFQHVVDILWRSLEATSRYHPQGLSGNAQVCLGLGGVVFLQRSFG